MRPSPTGRLPASSHPSQRPHRSPEEGSPARPNVPPCPQAEREAVLPSTAGLLTPRGGGQAGGRQGERRPSPVPPTVRALPLRGPESQRRSHARPPRGSAEVSARLRTRARGREVCDRRSVPAPRARGCGAVGPGRPPRGPTLRSRPASVPSGVSPAPTSSRVAGRREVVPRLDDLSDQIPGPAGASAAGRPALGTGRWEEVTHKIASSGSHKSPEIGNESSAIGTSSRIGSIMEPKMLMITFPGGHQILLILHLRSSSCLLAIPEQPGSSSQQHHFSRRLLCPPGWPLCRLQIEKVKFKPL
ncbi:homeobox protein cut-like 1 isoform X2 [Suricata suricatta]|uniref:homeobox protein cut-like 1 isoform X2 n=1 Tax=Suricata suricatta TaxID=37032 RepID=UPI001155FCDF|nr:homeobox protein cut-like 1 isoform X2 [Suricata suricatta]